MYLLYFFVALVATTIGSMTGMGGGVIIKPAMDFIGTYNAQTIGVISSITVFSMSIVSIIKQIQLKTKIKASMAVLIGLGSIIGGYIGEQILNMVINALKINNTILAIQNTLLSIIILSVFIYMLKKDKIKSKNFTGKFVYILVGFILGLISSFLGIGGGPINVALIIYLFSLDTKSAVLYSIITILFAQISKITTIILTTGFSPYDLTILPIMVIGAVMGGYMGSLINKRIPEKKVEILFNGTQLVVLALAITNVIKSFL